MASTVDPSSASEAEAKMEVENQEPAPQTTTAGSSSSAQFKVGDKVLAIHGPLRYIARILEIDAEHGYYVHYNGWSKKWDEWVPIDRLFEDNEENRKISDQLHQEVLNKSTKRASSTGSGSSKRKRDAPDDPEDEKDENEKGDDPAPVRLNLSDDLKTYIVRDWENLTQKNKICSLPKPAERSVSKILEDFAASKKKSAVYAQICEGLAVYFDRALPTMLLYRVERAQYDKLRAENSTKRNCELYGGEHLLRLFVRLPQLLANTELDETETKQLCARLQDLIKFLSKNSQDYFSMENDSAYIPYVPSDVTAAVSTTEPTGASEGTSKSS